MSPTLEVGDLVMVKAVSRPVKTDYGHYIGIIASIENVDRFDQPIYNIYWTHQDAITGYFYSEAIRYKNILDVYISRHQ